ncbi:hypothetical protein R1T08_33865 [Streptomyces sp. SBC-4]|nr:hypothetical protein [Streptomyces sp. SBC-4]MDV5148993.1 hypothetical protein [Streptomyces sp. SBC-4]
MIRHTARALCAASLVIAPLALSVTPAHAVTTCTVNGFPVTGTVVSGTPRSDVIRCASVANGDQVNGLGGSDTIIVTGSVAGLVTGGPGADYLSTPGTISGTVSGGDAADYLTAGTVAPSGAVTGGLGNDFLRVSVNAGVVDGSLGFDFCRVGVGNAPINCEA